MVVGKILVDGPDHPIAVGVGVVVDCVFGKDVAFGIGVARHVEPVASPALPIGGGGEEPVDDFFEGVGRFIADKGGDLFRRGRQARQLEGNAADQRAAIGGRGGRQRFGFQFREDKAVDRGLHPRGILHFGRRGLLDESERPVDTGGRRWDSGLRRSLAFRPRRAHADPVGQRGDLGGLQLARGRHLEGGIVPYGLDEQALVGIARDDGRPGPAARDQGGAGVQAKCTLLRLRSVAAKAFLKKHRPDAGLEELGLLRRRRLRGLSLLRYRPARRDEQSSGGSGARDNGNPCEQSHAIVSQQGE